LPKKEIFKKYKRKWNLDTVQLVIHPHQDDHHRDQVEVNALTALLMPKPSNFLKTSQIPSTNR
jgi:hypothetical protein